MYILGINSAYHEAAACLIKDGQIIMAIEEERLNRVKHGKLSSPSTSKHLPWNAINECLMAQGISLAQCDHIGYSYDPEILQTGVGLNTGADHKATDWDLSDNAYQSKEGGMAFLAGVLDAESQLREDGGFSGEFHFLPHHDCHAASAFHVSPFDKAAVLVVDGIGEWASTSLYYGNEQYIEKQRDIIFPNSLGFLWEKLSMYLGFSKYDASKVMGIAGYGHAGKTAEAFGKIVTNEQDMVIAMDVLKHESSDFSSLEALFGLPKLTAPLDFNNHKWSDYVHIAAGLQAVTERVLINILKSFDTSEYNYLCMAGGVALNCAANGKIVNEGLFKDIFIQPAAHDAGTALGAAYLIWNQKLGNPRAFVFENAYLGPEFSDEEIEEILIDSDFKYEYIGDDVAKVAQLIADGNIVGWFFGRMEWGPRALGNRSLLADPRNKSVRETMNVKVKHLERYRPFCPSILADKADEWFDIQHSCDANKYMLTTTIVHEHQREAISAVVHEDYTVRMQIVRQSDNERYFALISEFEKITGVPIILNTSFNDSEPVVCTPTDAVNTFAKTGIDYLAIGRYLVSKT
jgi:carbamoyltransferase